MSDTPKVVQFKKEPNKGAIEVLEEALAMAKSGEIKQCAVAWVSDRESIGGRWSQGSENLTMWSALSHGEREFYSAVIVGEGE